MRIISSAVVLLVVALVISIVGWRRERRRADTTARALDSLAVEVHAAEAARITAMSVVERARGAEVTARERVVDTFFESYIVSDSAAATLRDSSATTEDLRARLETMVASAQRMRQDAMAYQRSIDTLLLAHTAEREAWFAERAALVALQSRTADALAVSDCRVGLVRCPSRWQSFGVGVGLTLVLLML